MSVARYHPFEERQRDVGTEVEVPDGVDVEDRICHLIISQPETDRMYSKLKSFFSRPQRTTKHSELLRLESLLSRPVELIEDHIFRHFHPLTLGEISLELDQCMTKLEA